MLNRRSFLGGLSATLPLVSVPLLSRAQSARPRLHAMIVGLNTYTGRDAKGPIRALKGCVNDARDIAQQVGRLDPGFFGVLGTDARSGLEKGPVRRQDFFSAWREMLAAAVPGDTVLLTFSGHGFQVPVLPGNPTNEADCLDETLVLTGYSVSDGRNGEHIIDDELDELFRAAHAKGVVVVFVSDSCHSGTVYRAVELRDVSYRTLNPGQGARGSASAAACTVAAAAPPEAPLNLLFLAASQENELVPEISVGGQFHGALSVAVARALEGRAATDGVITAYSLARFVLGHVRDLSDGGQHPDVAWPPSRDQDAAERPTQATPTSVLGVRRDTRLFVLADRRTDAGAIGPVRLRILGRSAAEQQAIVSGLKNALLAGEADAAALVWDADRRLVLNDQRHRIAEDVDAGGLQHAIDRRLALERLIPLAAGGLQVKILLDGVETPASDATHTPGTKFDVAIGGVEGGYFCLFNLTGNGKVEMLEPYPGDPPNFDRPAFRSGARNDRSGADINVGGVVVKPEGPFGAEHVVAVAGALPLGRLMPALREAHNKLAVSAAMAGLASELETQPLRIGFRGIYTRRA
jgi:hypothetical protein